MYCVLIASLVALYMLLFACRLFRPIFILGLCCILLSVADTPYLLVLARSIIRFTPSYVFILLISCKLSSYEIYVIIISKIQQFRKCYNKYKISASLHMQPTPSKISLVASACRIRTIFILTVVK